MKLRFSPSGQPNRLLPTRLPPPQPLVLLLALASASLWAPSASAAIARIDAMEVTPKNDFLPDTSRFGVPPFQAADANIGHTLNIADCKAISAVQTGARVRFTWTWADKAAANLTPVYGLKLAPPGSNCDANSMTESVTANGCHVIWADRSFANGFSAAAEIADIDFKTLIGSYGSDPAGGPCNAGVEADAKIYFVLPTTTFGTAASGYLGTAMNVHLDLAPPPTPSMDEPAPGNGNLRITWTQADPTDTTISARVYWSATPFTPATAQNQASHSSTLSGTTYQITGLDNGTSYYVSVTAVDNHGNESWGAPVKMGVPVITYDLWSKYQESGGKEQGGFSPCSAGPRGRPLALASLGGLAVLLVLARRFRRGLPRRLQRLAALAAVAATAMAALPAAHAVSPQTASLDLRVIRYKPGIDNAFSSDGPYGKIMKDADFGFGATVDWRVWHGLGEVAIGIGIGRWSHEGTAVLRDGSASNDKTRLTVLPISLDAVYRFDVLAERWEFPLVPYAKLGADYAVWWMLDGVEKISRYTTKSGKSLSALGGTGGLHGTLGLRLLLDVFEPGAARSFDIEMGVNHSYVFAEVQKLWLNDFGSSKSINLSDTAFAFGLAFDL